MIVTSRSVPAADDARQRGIRQRAHRTLPGGNTRSTVYVAPHPPYAARCAGCQITDVDGHSVIDANNNYTSLVHGHAHPRIAAAAVEAIGRGSAVGLPTESEVRLAEALQARTGLERWRFCNSGSEAVAMAVRGARAATGRDLIVRFQGSYHGTSDAVVDGSLGIPQGVRDGVIVLPQADGEALRRTMEDHGDAVAAVLIDLMPSRAGLTPATAEFVELVRRLTERHRALMVVDEVITFRLAPGGLASRYGIAPDLTALGKVIGGGFPVGAVGGRADLLEAFNPVAERGVSWGGTFSANPVSMSAGLAALQLLDADAIARLNADGDALREQLRQAGLQVNGSGSLMRLILEDPTDDWWHLYRAGVLVGTIGLISLSTAMSAQDLARLAELIPATLGHGPTG